MPLLDALFYFIFFIYNVPKWLETIDSNNVKYLIVNIVKKIIQNDF